MNRFLKLSTWKNIIRSRTIDYKNSKTTWCKERREICNMCEYNSKNTKDLTFKDRFFMFIQITKEICKICGCSVLQKTKVAFSSCPKPEIGLKPSWKGQ